MKRISIEMMQKVNLEKKEDIKHISECIIEMNKDYFSKLQDSSLLSIDHEDSYNNEDNYINEDNMSSLEECPSDFEEWLKKSGKKLRYKGKLKSYLY